ncbi:glycosyltransferase family 4 protein [Nitrolancea hollandica]|uniref:glycosyltransferase family 4 protein n=1 Tax=Nitrolancea hollandica TaxID=1206749 RepID=UPI0002F19889|nr:glycosyltransferase family 1 protein [Nitrolancea hollandica]
MRIALDYTPALRQRAGVGRFTRSLGTALIGQLDDDERLILWNAGPDETRRQAAVMAAGNQRVVRRRVPVPERWLTIAWHQLRLPVPVERFIGDVDLVHAPDFVAPPSQAPAIVTIHDLSYLITPEFAFPNLRRYLSQAVPRTLERVSRIVAVSQTTANDLSERYRIDPGRIAVIPNGVDPMFRPTDPDEARQTIARLGVREPYVLIVGTIEPRKNHQALLRAFEQVHTANPEVSLVIAGSPGWLSESIMDAIGRHAQRLPVQHLRNVDDAALPALYARSIALVYPSWYEGFGLPVVEAMACGTAVITSDRGATAEVAGDGALLVSPDDTGSIARAMAQVYGDPELRARLIEHGIDRAKEFSWDAAASAYRRLYRDVAVTARRFQPNGTA